MTNIFKLILTELRKLQTSVTDKSVEMEGFTAVIKGNQKNNTKLEEIKSAILIANRLLKEIRDKEMPKPEKFPPFPEIPKTDLTETNKLLKQLLEKQGKDRNHP